MEVWDHLQDSAGIELHQISQRYNPPDFVKNATREQLYPARATIPTHLFGEPGTRLYPCNNPATTWASCAFFFAKQAEMSPKSAAPIEKKLLQAATWFNMLPAVNSLREKIAADKLRDEESLPDDAFALLWETENGKERHYPLRNAGEVKIAASYLLQYRDEYAFNDRARMAQKIIEKADAYAADLPQRPELSKIAGYGLSAVTETVAALEKRAAWLQRTDATAAAELRTLVASLAGKTTADLSQAHRMRLAETLDEFDRVTHLKAKYAEWLPRPEDSLFGVTEYTLRDSADNYIATARGSIYEKSAVEAVPLSVIRDYMGSAFAQQIATGGVFVDGVKAANALVDLTDSENALFERMLEDHGVRPTAQACVTRAVGLADSERAALADAYFTAQA